MALVCLEELFKWSRVASGCHVRQQRCRVLAEVTTPLGHWGCSPQGRGDTLLLMGKPKPTMLLRGQFMHLNSASPGEVSPQILLSDLL